MGGFVGCDVLSVFNTCNTINPLSYHYAYIHLINLPNPYKKYSNTMQNYLTPLSSLVFCLSLISSHANATTNNIILTPIAPQVAAKSYVLVDANSGKVLAEQQADVKLLPASLTKVMTTYVVFTELKNERLTLNERATISKKAWQTPGSRTFIEVNKQVTIKDLLQGVIVQSGNDASVALAEHIAGDEAAFVAMMNQHAKRLGMFNTHFQNSTGLPHANHYTTANDLATLAIAIIRDFPVYYRWYAQKEFTYNNISQPNRNKLLWRDKTVDGIKTGYTEEAGYCIVTSALRNDMRLISVVMNAKTVNARTIASQKLLNYGFRFFTTHKLYQGLTALKEAKVWKGDSKQLSIGLQDDLYITIPRRYYKDLKANTVVDNPIIAPVKQGEALGSVEVSLAGKVISKQPLIALKAVNAGGFVRRIYDAALLFVGAM